MFLKKKYLTHKIRARWKGVFFHKCTNLNKNIRNSVIMPFNIDKNYKVHTGKKYKLLGIKEKMVGYKFGQFILTKKIGKFHKTIDKKNNKKKK